MSRPYLGVGQKFPPEINSSGRITLVDDVALIKQSLQILFAEPIGTEFFREHYGSQIRECQFEPNDVVLQSLLDYYIISAIAEWERRIQVSDIQYARSASKASLVMVTIYFRVKGQTEIDSFIFPYYRELIN